MTAPFTTRLQEPVGEELCIADHSGLDVVSRSTPSRGTLPLSVIIPVHNCPEILRECISWLKHSHCSEEYELIVVDDASTDNTVEVAEELGARVVCLQKNAGPAGARNAGADVANGEVLLFIDSDVGVKPETLDDIMATFRRDPQLDAVFGSYDVSPRAGNVLSQYRNLFHHFVHQTSDPQATTFWAGCGAVRTTVFRKMGGFDVNYKRPSIEDIAFGMRLSKAGGKIQLNKAIQVSHFKRWTFTGIVKTDLWDRGIPWTQLILANGGMPNDLNLKNSQRLCVVSAFLLLVAFLLGTLSSHGLLLLIPVGLFLSVLAIDSWSSFYRVPIVARIVGVIAALVSAGMMAIWVPVASAFIAIFVAFIIMLNFKMYVFFARERSLLFSVVVVPMHVLYFIYCGLAFLLGSWLHLSKGKPNIDNGQPSDLSRAGSGNLSESA